MKTQISSCPKCGNILLDDATSCHDCGHVLEQQSPKPAAAKPRVIVRDANNEEMEICSQCGEECRTGLVRCWSCGAFLRPEIEEAYRRMRSSNRYEVEHVELPIIEATNVTQEDSLQRRVTTPDSFLAENSYSSDASEGDDFELAEGSVLGEDDDNSFDLDQDLLLSDQSDEASELTDSKMFDIPDEVGLPLRVAEEVAPIEPPIQEIATDIAAAPEGEMKVPAASEEPAATPEDDLHRIATDEEKDISRVRKSLRSKDTFLIYCPNGCRIRVKEKHRGLSGRCPRCQSTFVVPPKAVAKTTPAEVAPPPVSKYKHWMTDVRLHTVDPLKLRIKADSLLNECQAVDIGFSEDDLVVVSLVAGKFGTTAKKAAPVRTAMLEHFLKGGSVAILAAAAKSAYTKDQIGQIALAQPTPPGTESLFHDIPVFGTNRIAVRLPKLSDETQPKYLSFSLSEYRTFVKSLDEICGVKDFGAHNDIPLTDVYLKHKCKINDSKFQELTKLNYYEKDPGFKLEVSGWKCAACGITISEAGRAEKKLGGANGKAIAKAKCPSCTKPMGNKPLYQLVGSDKPEKTEEEV